MIIIIVFIFARVIGGGRINASVTGALVPWCHGGGLAFVSGPGRLGMWLGLQPQKRGVSKCSVQPGGCQRGRTPRLSGLRRSDSSDMPLGTAVSRLNRTLRNITVFSDGAPTTSPNAPGRRQKPGRRHDARERSPCDGCIYPGGLCVEGAKREMRIMGEGKEGDFFKDF